MRQGQGSLIKVITGLHIDFNFNNYNCLELIVAIIEVNNKSGGLMLT